MNTPNEFLIHSIQDIQSTIRALDVKLGFLFIIYCAPIASLKDVADLAPKYPVAAWPLFSLWIIGIICLYLALRPNTLGHPEFQSSFYKRNIFKRTILPQRIVNISLDDYLSSIPKDTQDIQKDLAKEVISLSYVRDFKSSFTAYTVWCAIAILIITFLNLLAFLAT